MNFFCIILGLAGYDRHGVAAISAYAALKPWIRWITITTPSLSTPNRWGYARKTKE